MPFQESGLTFPQPYVTEIDLRHSLIPDELIEDLLHTMPAHTGPDLQEDRDLPKYDYITFMEKMMDEGKVSRPQSMQNGGKENGKPAIVNGKHH